MITLSREELMMAGMVGLMRRVESKVAGLRDADSYQSATPWEDDIEGAIAELAYCKWRGIHWAGTVGSFKGADVGDNVQIRHTRLRQGSLIIRPKDNLDHYYVLVVGEIPSYRIAGWIHGRDAVVDRYVRDPDGKGKAWFVPQKTLNPLRSAA